MTNCDSQIYSITLSNKKYNYFIKKTDSNVCYFECKSANIAQEFLNEDIADLLLDLPNLITAEKEHQEKQNNFITFRISTDDKQYIEQKAIKKGYVSVSSFLKDLAMRA